MTRPESSPSSPVGPDVVHRTEDPSRPVADQPLCECGHAPDRHHSSGVCVGCPCGDYSPVCAVCGGRVEWLEPHPDGSWWAHEKHPQDGHDVVLDRPGAAFLNAARTGLRGMGMWP